MLTANFRFGGGASETQIHPLVVVFLLIVVLLILTLPREKVIAPFLLAFFTIPVGQVVVVGGLHFTALRILILAGLVRRASFLGASSEGKQGKYPRGFNAVDWVVVLWSVSALIAFCLEFREKQALINGLGNLLDTLGGYLVVRSLILDGAGIRRTIKVLAAICLIQGVCMINEKISNINVFGLLGGVPLQVTIRDGHIRSEGTMGCLYAGAFAGVLIPLFLWLWTEGKSRMVALVGIAGATAMVITSYSSTSYLAYGASFVGLAFWPLRKKMRLVRWGLGTTLVGLHLVMKAPVWALIARIDLTGSSSGYQRYGLVDMCIRHFSDWWLLGAKDYPTWGWGSWDLVNQFVAVALTGGLMTLVFYIAIFTRSFGAIGTARKHVDGDRGQEWFLWCLGSDLFANVVAHFGINYLAHLIMSFFPLVVFISVATFEAKQGAFQQAPDQVRLASAPGAAGAYVLDEVKQNARQDLSSRERERVPSWLKA
jgi:hypothetical protein